MSGDWGSGTWGSGSWGGGTTSAADFLDAVPIRENVIRVEFDEAIYFSGIFDQDDAAIVTKWAVAADGSTTGLTGEAARPVSVVRIEVTGAADGVAAADAGRFLSLVLDRPMTPCPAKYAVSWTGLRGAGGDPVTDGSFELFSTYRKVEPPTLIAARSTRDFANPQSVAAARESVPNPTGPAVLGSFGYADDGDYAIDSGDVSLKKRCLRRVMTRKDAFAHLPGYGAGLPDAAKKVANGALVASLNAEAEAQILQEPDVAAAKVQVITSSETPNMARVRIAVRPKAGPPLAFEAPFEIA